MSKRKGGEGVEAVVEGGRARRRTRSKKINLTDDKIAQIIADTYLIFVISFTQAGFSNSKFYT